MKTWICGHCEAVNDARMRVCDHCGEEPIRGLKSAPPAMGAGRCACGDLAQSMTFHEDGHPDDRGKKLCAGCWVEALKRRAALDPMPAEQRAAWRALVLRGAE